MDYKGLIFGLVRLLSALAVGGVILVIIQLIFRRYDK